MELIEFSQTRIPKGAIEFPRSGLTQPRPTGPLEPVIWTGRVKYTATQRVAIWAKVRAWISRPAAIAAQDLPAGKPIQSHQFGMESADTGPFSDSAPISADQVAGFAPRRSIRAGQSIPRSILEAPIEVARSEMAGVEAHYGAAFLKFEARAETSGRVGDAIQMRNVESGKTFRARVIRKGWVAVD